MITRPKFGTDGVRGTFGKDIDSQYAYFLGIAIARTLGTDSEFIIGRDTRVSGQVLSNALKDGLVFGGAKTLDVGILPTPAIAMIARRDSKRACVITASHNPATDNGIKVFDVGGAKIASEVEMKLEDTLDLVFNESLTYSEDVTPTPLETISSQEYVSYLVDLVGSKALEGLKVVLDCANGASYKTALSAFLLCGARVTAINVESDGLHINEECGATHLASLVKEVRATKADIGFAFDGDADRVIAVDEKGTIRDGDIILALFAAEMKANDNLSGNSVVATSMSNGALKTFLKENAIDFVETQVGDKYVLEALIENDYSLGGEQSGHIIRRDFSNWGDGILNALLVARILNEGRINERDFKVSNAFDLFEPLVQRHSKVLVNDRSLVDGNSEIEKAINQERELLGEESRIIIRPSGTEPVIRITVEGRTESEVANSIERLEKIVESVCG
jgi:phosphoglucosamine mutase